MIEPFYCTICSIPEESILIVHINGKRKHSQADDDDEGGEEGSGVVDYHEGVEPQGSAGEGIRRARQS